MWLSLDFNGERGNVCRVKAEKNEDGRMKMSYLGKGKDDRGHLWKSGLGYQ